MNERALNLEKINTNMVQVNCTSTGDPVSLRSRFTTHTHTITYRQTKHNHHHHNNNHNHLYLQPRNSMQALTGSFRVTKSQMLAFHWRLDLTTTIQELTNKDRKGSKLFILFSFIHPSVSIHQ